MDRASVFADVRTIEHNGETFYLAGDLGKLIVHSGIVRMFYNYKTFCYIGLNTNLKISFGDV